MFGEIWTSFLRLERSGERRAFGVWRLARSGERLAESMEQRVLSVGVKNCAQKKS